MAIAEGEEEMREWRTLFEETLTEDKNIVLSGFEGCREIEAYVIFNTAMSGTLYLTSVGNGTIYGEPRARLEKKTTIGIGMLRMEIVNPSLISNQIRYSNYYNNINGDSVTVRDCYNHKIGTSVFNVEAFTQCSLMVDNETLKSGDIVFIRGR